MTRRQVRSRLDMHKVRVFILKRFEAIGEGVADFIGATDYTQQSVLLVLSGDVGSPRIRQDLARYLGYNRWWDLVNDYIETEGVNLPPVESEKEGASS